jgi:hypothetical protein
MRLRAVQRRNGLPASIGHRAAHAWVEEHLPERAKTLGGAIAVESRCSADGPLRQAHAARAYERGVPGPADPARAARVPRALERASAEGTSVRVGYLAAA